MKVLLILVFLCGVVADSGAEEAKAWIAVPVGQQRGPDESKALEGANVFEVVASKAGVATSRDLLKQAIVEISEETARYYTGGYYRCPNGMKPYLVRAPYGFGGTGRYLVVRFETAIWVEHRSLGEDVAVNKSALIVNLDFVPTTAYATVSVIR
jgi:hypothetical protein